MTLKSWQGKTIYFILTDRFYNGDKSNDDFGKGEYDPKNDDCFQGGDLKGITKKLPHIKKMGFDALWLTPPVHNQWINPYIATRGFHGYWAYDFTQVDPHFGTLDDYKTMVRKAHALGLQVIQDIVVNHTGNFFTVAEKDYDPKRPEKNWRRVIKKGAKAPRDPVFRLNNPNIPEHKKAAVYNFTPNISDFKNREQTLTYSMGDLDDINLHSPLAANRMKEIYRYWIEEAGIDGFRVDTVYYTPEDFYEGFLFDDDPKNLGVKRFAAQKGKGEFFVFGEAWSYDYKAINKYLKDGRTARLDSAIDLPLNEALTQVFYRKTATAELKKVLSAKRHNPTLWVNFLDNHDVERINGRAGWASVKQSLVALFTLPGIPCVYYGTEAGFKAPRENMFREKHFKTGGKYYTFLRRLLRFRKLHPALSVGKCAVERTAYTSGVLSYTLSHENQRYRVIFNTSTDKMHYDLGGEDRAFEVLLSSGKRKSVRGSLLLEADAYWVLREKPAKRRIRARSAVRLLSVKKSARPAEMTVRFAVSPGAGVTGLSLLADDNYAKRLPVRNLRGGKLSLDTARLGNGRHTISLLAARGARPPARSNDALITVRNKYRRLATTAVAPENKRGGAWRLFPPADPSYDEQMSLESVSAYSSGTDLRLRLKMANVTDDWNPPHGYDHVYFSVFFDFPGRKGLRVLPRLNYGRKDFAFNAGFLLYGWGAQSFGVKGSSAGAYGEPLLGEVAQAVDRKRKTVTFTFSNKYFQSLKNLSGVKIFISTWDGYLADFRRVAGRKGDWEFYTLGGGDLKDVPHVFDFAMMEL